MMARSMGMATLALGAVLAISGFARADDGNTTKYGLTGGVITLGGKGTIADAAIGTDDVEETCYRRYYGYGGGYYSSYGYGYGSGYYGGGYGYGYPRAIAYGGYYGGYRPGYYGGYRPIYHAGLRPGFGYQHGYYHRIAGDSEDVSAPAVNLNGTTGEQAPTQAPSYKFKAFGEK